MSSKKYRIRSSTPLKKLSKDMAELNGSHLYSRGTTPDHILEYSQAGALFSLQAKKATCKKTSKILLENRNPSNRTCCALENEVNLTLAIRTLWATRIYWPGRSPIPMLALRNMIVAAIKAKQNWLPSEYQIRRFFSMK